MKKLLSTCLLLLLVLSMVASCGPTPPDPDQGPSNGSDAIQPSDDPSVKDAIGSVSPTGSEFINQSGTHIGDMILNDSYDNFLVASSFPSPDYVIEQGRFDYPIYGVYGASTELEQYADDLVEMGIGPLRFGLSRGMSDQQFLTLLEGGFTLMATGGGKKLTDGETYEPISDRPGYFRSGFFVTNEEPGVDGNKTLQEQLREYFDTDHYEFADWILAFVDAKLEVLERFGPHGTFWEDYPEAPYRPLTLLEVTNEPNFQYTLPLKKANGADDANAEQKGKAYAMLQVCLYHVLQNEYGGEVKQLGFGAGGAGMLDVFFIEYVCGLSKNAEMRVMLNEVIASSDRLRELMGLEVGEEIDLDIAGTMDILSTHPYFTPSPFAATDGSQCLSYNLKKIREAVEKCAMREEDKDIPIWYSECGYDLKGRDNVKADMDKGSAGVYSDLYEGYEYNADDWGFVKYGAGGNGIGVESGVNQITQAAMLVQKYVFGLRCGVGAITYMEVNDTDGCNFGLFNFLSSGRGDQSWRMCNYAIQVMTTLMPHPLLKEVVHEGLDVATGNYYYCYTFESDVGGEDVTVAFTAKEATTIQVPWDDAYALVTDMMGTTKIVAAQNGYIVLDGGACMMYIREVDNATLIENGIMTEVPEIIETAMWQEKREEY